jgi:hypothetical protein
VIYECLISGGVTATERFDFGDNISFMEDCSEIGSAGSSLSGEVEQNARAPGRSCLCEGADRFSRALSMESFLEAMFTVRWESLSGRKAWFHHDSPPGSHRVITPFSCGCLIG